MQSALSTRVQLGAFELDLKAVPLSKSIDPIRIVEPLSCLSIWIIYSHLGLLRLHNNLPSRQSSWVGSSRPPTCEGGNHQSEPARR
jgi:hypothetical protein